MLNNWNISGRPVYWGINEDNYLEQDGLIYVVQDGNAVLTGHKAGIVDMFIPESITINESIYSVVGIAKDALKNCTTLTNITIPSSVVDINLNAFYGCGVTGTVTVDGNHPKYYSDSNCIIETETKTLAFGFVSSVIPSDGSVVKIGEYAFYGRSGLTSITIPDCVTRIDMYAFNGCSDLSSVYISSLEAWCGRSFGGNFANPLYYAKNLYLNDELVTELVIPDGVTGVSAYAFYSYTGLTSVVMPNSVTSIGQYAFCNCTGLTSVVIPNGVTSIGGYSFYGCRGLSNITIPSSVTSIGQYAFYNCTGLTGVVIPNGVTSIGDHSFYGCSNVENVYIPQSVTSIGAYAFNKCKSSMKLHIENLEAWFGIEFSNKDENPISYIKCFYLNGEKVTELVIPSSVTSINQYAFYNCTELRSIVIPDGVTNIGRCAFYGCKSVRVVVIPNSITSIERDAFNGCSWLSSGGVRISSLEDWCCISFGNEYANPLYYAHTLYLNDELVIDLVIPNGVTSIGDYAFYGCNNLTSVTISDTVTSIGSNVFGNCGNIRSIFIPSSVISVGSKAFYNNQKTAIYCEATSQPSEWNSDLMRNWWRPIYWGINENNYLEQEGLSFVVQDGNAIVTGYKVGVAEVEIPSSITINGNTYNVTSIAPYAFYYCDSMTSVVIPNSVNSIEEYAFNFCSELTSIVIPDGVTSIGEGAFEVCRKLTSITIPNSVTFIGNYAISYAEIFVYNNYDNGLYLGNDTNPYLVFVRMVDASKTSCLIHEGTRFICDNAFNRMSITNIVIPDGVISIGDYAFYNCSDLTSIVIPDSVTSIGYGTFENCTGLTSIVIPDGVTSIGDYAFEGCSGLTIYCEAESQPEGWESYWNPSNYPVVWGYVAEEE